MGKKIQWLRDALRDALIIGGICVLAVFVLRANWEALGKPAAPAAIDPCAGMETVQAASGVAVCKPAGMSLRTIGTIFPRDKKE